MTAQALEEGYGQDYLAWKDWGGQGFQAISPQETAYFDAEITRLPLTGTAALNILEVGFGNGSFLAYCKARGWSVSGTELIDPLIAVARQKGVDARKGLADFSADSFDLIAAFDVLEHIPSDDIVGFIGALKRVAKPGAILIARFPNGDSPIGLVYQNGDLTHVNAIGSSKLKHIAQRAGVEILFVAGQAKTTAGYSLKAKLRHAVASTVQSIINNAVPKLFLPGWEGTDFCSPNIIAAIRL